MMRVTPSTGFFHWAANTLTGVPNFLKSLENATCFVSISRNKLLYYDLFIFSFILVLCNVSQVDAVMN